MMNLFILLLGLVLLFPFNGKAWDIKDFKEEALTPVTTDAKYVLMGGTAVTLAIVLFDHPVSDPFQKKQVRNKTLGESSRWGDWMGQLIPNALYIGAMSLSGYNGDPEGYRRAIGMFKATAYSTSVTTVMKYTIRSRRPIDRNWRTSFPSGHATSAFAFSGYVMAEHQYYIGIPSLLLATFVGYSRINDNMHWLQDVTAGATIGWVYGWGISKYQQKNKKKKDEPMTFVMPVLDSQTAGLTLYKEF